ncbi:MAG TPA: fimbria/pilus periplasmic chaperone [Coleofasciculaceae cyanobacterium]|jgi:fimbrial chaperone protein
MKRYFNLLFVSLFFVLMRVNPALAFRLTPMTQVFAPAGNNATHAYNVVNDKDERVAVEITVVERNVDANGTESYIPAEDDFLIYPAQMILEPNTTQVVRVSWLGDPEPEQELAFRLVAEQLPINLVDPDAPILVQPVGQVQVLLRYLGALFVRPEGVQAAVQIESVTAQSGEQATPTVSINFINQGNASASLRDLKLSLTAQGQTISLTPAQLEGVTGYTILAGHRRSFVVPRPDALPQGPITATFEYRQD